MTPAPVPGHVEVIGGPMFAGKTEELVRRVRRARIAGQLAVVINHVLDERSGAGRVASHSGVSEDSQTVATADAVRNLVGGLASPPDLVAIDEAQFFGPDLVAVVDELAAQGVVVLVAGLSVTFDARPFEPLPTLMATAEVVTRLTAVCSVCGGEAAFHQRSRQESTTDALAPGPEHVGGSDTYRARCRHHLSAQ